MLVFISKSRPKGYELVLDLHASQNVSIIWKFYHWKYMYIYFEMCLPITVLITNLKRQLTQYSYYEWL